MYKKVIKKYSLYKLFIWALPKTVLPNKACYYLCKYLIKLTPYGSLIMFLQEIKRILNILLQFSARKEFIFICSDKIYLLEVGRLKLRNRVMNLTSTNLTFLAKELPVTISSAVIWYNLNYNTKLLGFLKGRKLLTLGFINFHNFPNIADYILLLENRFFSSIFLFHFFLKKFINYDKQ